MKKPALQEQRTLIRKKIQKCKLGQGYGSLLKLVRDIGILSRGKCGAAEDC